MKRPARTLLGAAVALAFSTATLAQLAPDAGRTLREQQPAPEAPKPSPSIVIDAPKPAPAQPGGLRVSIETVQFSGNTVFGEAELREVLGDLRGRTFDLAELRELADRISAHYRGAGYPFARAFLPPQALKDGLLRIEVVEGRYGRVAASGEKALVAGATPFLEALKPGEVIEAGRLERSLLILDDQPGVRVAPFIRPGQEVGTGDLEARLERTERVHGQAGIDNHGNRYTGALRGRVSVYADSPFQFGDQLALQGILTEESLWLGSLAYGMPVGSSGLRAQVGYSRTYYELGKEFAALDATGTADIWSAGLTYPLVRSQARNLTAGATLQHKALEDRQGATGTSNEKSSDSLALTLSLDLRDGFGGGGLTYGVLGWTPGRLRLDDTLASVDRVSARTEGSFQRANLDVVRLQTVTREITGYARLSAQWASKNLDSSEGFGLGGPAGVRAYPVGEGFGDEGWLTQLELRYSAGAVSPYVFYDAGEVRVNARPWAGGPNRRSLAGAGAGVRYAAGRWNLDAAVAWRTRGGAPQSDTADRDPRVWISASYAF